ncbi:cytochrome c biogenesis protein CcdA [Crossiella equi]|uniref:Cytochrome c biogenesis protein CcdA n=1 Tax=Crossiella equi TaxID=130796 RepID=A0ABS5AHS3_9PSEU|nr:GAP family protein [Crossiella equi]MBP2475911.1 cytochrome c biogenesis protein CcdA [Crossiella equi]
MTFLWAVFGLALVDSINPSALAVTIYLLLSGKERPTARVLTYIAAIFTTYLVFGILLMFGLNAIFTSLGDALNSPYAYIIQFVVGLLMLYFAIWPPKKKEDAPRERMPKTQRLPAVFALGVTITAVEFVTALPYIAAIGLLTQQDLGVVQWLPILLAYNAIFILPPLLLLVAYQLFGNKIRPRLERFQEKFRKNSRDTWLWILGIVGFLITRNAFGFLIKYYNIIPPNND